MRLQYVQGEQERALKGIRSLLRRHPHHVDTILLYVDFLEDMADYDEAVQVLQKKLRYAEDPRFIDRLQQLTGDAAAQAERTMRRPRFENLDVPSARRARSDSNSSDGRSREPLPSRKHRTSGPSIRGPAEEPPTAESAIPITLMHALQQSADRSEGEETQQYVPESARPQSELNRVTSVTDVSGQSEFPEAETQPNIRIGRRGDHACHRTAAGSRWRGDHRVRSVWDAESSQDSR